MSIEIEKLIDNENWVVARAAIESELLSEPDSHWLLTRLALTYYEQKEYKKALEIGKKALEKEPTCPLALWDYAGSLQMIGSDKEAIEIYTRLIKRGVNNVAYGDCGEGKDWASGILLDCYYRRSLSFISLNRTSDALKDLEYYKKQRPSTSESIYTLEEAQAKCEKLHA